MDGIDTLFWDVGGVLLTNGWDRSARARAVERYRLEGSEFEERHEQVVADFETGCLTLEEYLQRTVFYRSRLFRRDEFVQFMLAQSQAKPETVALARALAEKRRYLMATLNNESSELNQFRIRRFALGDCFTVFFSSCYLGVRKPAESFYRRALQLTQRGPGQCVFIDDRALNLECAAQLGIHTIHFRDVETLRADLARLGIHAGTGPNLHRGELCKRE